MSTSRKQIGVVSLVAACIGVALVALILQPVQETRLDHLAIWLAACFVGEIFWVSVGGGQGTISMALAVDLAALCSLGEGGGMLVVGLSTLLAGLYPHRRAWHKALFNSAQSVLAAFAAQRVLALFPAHLALNSLPTESWWPALYAAGIAFFVVNSALVAWVIALQAGQSPWRIWRHHFGSPFELLSTLALLTLGGFLLVAYQQFGVTALIALIPLMAVLRRSSEHEARQREARPDEPAESPEEIRRAG